MGDQESEITYGGPAPLAPMLVTMLEREGVRVTWTPPLEQRGAGTEVVIGMIASGGVEVIKTVIGKFLRRVPTARVEYKPRHRSD